MEQSYKEKYEQALERAKTLYENANGMILKKWVEQVFPELRETDDEKIRKEIIRFIRMEVEDEIVGNKWLAWLEKQGQVKESAISQHENRTCEENGNSLTCEDEKVRKALLELVHDTTGDELWIDYNVHKEEALDWLERQGEHANFRNKIQVGDKVTRNENGVLVNLSQLNRVAKPEENKGNIGGISPNWSEEDKGIIEEVVSYLINYSNIVESKEDADRIEYLIDKIQDICPHQKQEWSEEDEQHIDSLLKRLDALCRNKFERTRFAISEDRDWLKSLRHQNRWKPSDEQMGCLSDAIEHYNSLGYPASKLKELLDDLKKLKEGDV